MPNWQRGMMRALRIPNHPITVESIHDFTPWYRRITFHAAELVQKVEFSPSLWLRLWVPDIEHGEDLLRQRGYTFVAPRARQGTFALDFVLHETAGAAGDWARRAEIGDRREAALTLRPVRVPESTTHLLLVGDATALPAINSWIDYASDDVSISVAVEDDHSDHEDLPQATHPRLDWTWVKPDDGPRGHALASHVRAAYTPAPSETYAWAAGERTLVKAIRPLLKEHLELGRAHQFSQFYWVEGKPFG